MIKIDQISLPIKFTDFDIQEQICKKLKITQKDISE